MRIQANYHEQEKKFPFLLHHQDRKTTTTKKFHFFPPRFMKNAASELMEDFSPMKGIRGGARRGKYTKPIAVIIINSKTHIHMRS